MKQIWDEVSDLMVESADFYAETGNNKYNEISYSSTANHVLGRIIAEEKRVLNAQGVEVIQIGKLITHGLATINVSDKMAVAGVPCSIISVDPINDENGLHHVVVSFGR